MSTKDIAQFTNLTIRGVETARYRITLCAATVRLYRLHAGNRGVHVRVRLAHGLGGAVGGARGGGADSGK